MSGICQCPICGDLYYGDERDDWQTCRCTPPTPPEDIARRRAEHEREVDAWMATVDEREGA